METVIEPLLSIDQAASLLGVAPVTVWRAVRRGELRPVRIGAHGGKDRTLIEPCELRDFIERSKAPRNEDLGAEVAA